jgi:hypothetical protein
MKRYLIFTVLMVAAAGLAVGQDMPIRIGDSVMGDLSSSDEVLDVDGSFIDWYSVNVSGDTRFGVTLRSQDFDAYLIVELPNGQFLEDDDSGGSATGEMWGTDSALTVVTSDRGTVRIGVNSYSPGATGRYTLTVEEVEVLELSVGGTARGMFENTDIMYVLYGEPGESVEVELTSDDFDTYLELEDSQGTYLYNDDADGIHVSRLMHVMGPDGMATVTVSAFGSGFGNYALTARTIDVGALTLPDGYRLSDGETVEAMLLPSPDEYHGSFYQRFTFMAEAGERVEIIHRSNEFDCYLGVISPSGREWTDDDGAGSLDSRLMIMIESSGIHEVYASSLGSGRTGRFTLEFTRHGAASVLESGSGAISRDDESDIQGRYYDIYEFSSPAGGEITIDVTSDDVDLYAILRDSRGEIVARDDDSGGSGNPRIEFYASPGVVYQLAITTYSWERFGRYSYTIIE